jgi:DNA-binding NarL/FixJ family response regulator
MIKIMICDDQDVVREGLKAILSTDGELQVVGLARDGAEALDLLAKVQPDLVLMDLKMPLMNGIQATSRIQKEFPQVKVLVLTTYDADEWVFDAIRSGAAGYLLKDTPREALLAAIKGTVAGQTHVDPQVAGKIFARVAQGTPLPPPAFLAELSDREREILVLLAHGLSNPDIAGRLYLSEGTVRNYISILLSKLNVTDRTQAAVLAWRYGLMDK